VDQPAPLTIQVADHPLARLESAELLTGPDRKAANSLEAPDRVRAHAFEHLGVAVSFHGGAAVVELPPLSAAAMTFGLQ
jgi:alpha-L-arabinofuranosidase